MCNQENRPYLWGWNGDKEVVWFRPNCGSWSCPECAIANKHRWAKRIYHGIETYKLRGDSWYFATITSHEKLKTFEATLGVWRKAWPGLYAKMKRVKPDLHYASLPEQHKDGRLHMHMIINCGFGATSKDEQGRWIKDEPRKSGFGYKNEIEPLQDAMLAAYYVTKYVSKSLGVEQWPKHLRRVRVSNSWPILPPESDFEPLAVDYSITLEKTQFEAILGRFALSGVKVRALSVKDQEELYRQQFNS